MTRDEAFYAFGKATGDEQIGQCYPEMRRLGALPAPDAPLHEHLAFVGRVAEAIGARDVAVSWTRMPFKDRVGFVLSPDPRAPDAKRHERHGYHEGGDISHAALLAALAALESR